MKKQFGKEMWNATREYAVWLPGATVGLGDYGTMSESCFEKIGNVRELLTGFTPKKSQSSLDEIQFHSDGVSEAVADATGPGNLVTVTYSLSIASGVVFRAKGLSVSAISNLNDLSQQLRNCEEWNRSWRVVTSVTSAENFFTFVGSSAGTRFSVTSDFSVFPQLDVPVSKADAAIRFEGDCALKIMGQGGPVSVQLHRLRLLGQGLKRATPAEQHQDVSGLVPYLDEPGAE